ncbi:MAG: hypothetical protein KC425_16065 [Anaerolineales bacterium]|nr:hypothetical protein [Anaerolineales bacterium]
MRRRLTVGDGAPECVLQTVNGEAVRLGAVWENGRGALLLFLRHLA